MTRIKILFRLDSIYHMAAIDPLIKEFLADDRYDSALETGREPARVFKLFRVSRRKQVLPLIESSGLRLAVAGEHFDIVVVGDIISDAKKYGRTLLCMVNHGTGIKTVIIRRLRKHQATRYNLFVEGDFRVRMLEDANVLGASEIFKIGLPKLDPYFAGNFKRAAILSELGLNPDRKTVLFAPTYNPTCIAQVKDHIFTETTDYNLIIKLHHYSWMGHYAPHRHHRLFEKRVPRYPHAVLLPQSSHNILPFMSAADVLISEASSTVFDFLALSKFGVIYNLDHDRLLHSDGEPILAVDNRDFLRDAFVHIDAPDQIATAVAQALKPSPKMVQSAEQYRKHMFFRWDGGAAKRFKETVERLFDEGVRFNEV